MSRQQTQYFGKQVRPQHLDKKVSLKCKIKREKEREKERGENEDFTDMTYELALLQLKLLTHTNT